jgi:DNA-binding CsgD family transcriptional regulator
VLGARVAALEAELALLRWHPDDVRRLLAEAERQLENVTAPAGLRSALDALADLLLVLEGGTTDRTPAAVVLADLLSGGEPSVAVTGGTTVEAALGEIARLSPDAPRGLGLVVDTIHAVAERLAADPADGGLALPEAVTTLAGAPWLGAVLVLRGAPAALTGGSSAPLRDALREAIDILDDLPGGTTAAERCRDLIRRAGAAYPRRTSAQAGVPPGLQRRGITAREWQVLTLVGEGLTSREIAQRLYLSPRTVEKHVERMLGKTGAANRAALAALSAAEDVT